MEFSRHPHARAERLDQIAGMLGDVYPAVSQPLPPIIAEKLKQLERAELNAKPPTDGKLCGSFDH